MEVIKLGNVVNLTLAQFGIDWRKYFNPRKPILINGMSFAPNSKIVDDVDVYDIAYMPSNINEIGNNYFKNTTAYIDNDTFYIYRGDEDSSNKEKVKNLKPGIYRDTKVNPESKFFIIKPETLKEKEKYNAFNNISTIHKTSLIDAANSNAEIYIAIPENSKIFQPEITEKDDILKVIAKKALLMKNVDLDRYKDRFSNKNELFNFKQVLRSDSKLSMKIFMRGMEALNLIFTIIVSEKSANNVVGDRLTKPIETSSEETFEMSA